tara:strand:- start:126 stop:599 length:474 start_codon:yes stop_codon:yes gene_type:complete
MWFSHQKAQQGRGGGRVQLLGSHQLSGQMMSFLNRVSLRAGVPLVVTSGNRRAADQASAMLYKLNHKGGAAELRSLYRRNGDLVEELLAAPQDDWTEVIQGQIDRGRYLSSHLTGRAADLRSRDWKGDQRSRIERAIREEGGRPVFEGDHLHVEGPK